MYPPLIFDLDGTLLDTLPDIQWALNTALGDFGLPTHDRESVRQMVGHGLPELVRQAMGGKPAGASLDPGLEEKARIVTSRLREIYREFPWKDTQPYPGIPALLASLKSRGAKLAVLTNKAQTVAELVVAHFFPGVFDLVSGESPDRPRKPDPQAFFSTLETLAPGAEKAILIGDSDVDIKTAVNARMPGVAVLWGFRTREELESAGAKVFAADSGELAAILETMQEDRS